MARKRLGAEQIVTKLRQIEVLQFQCKTIANDVLVLVKKLGVVDAKVEGRIVIQ